MKVELDSLPADTLSPNPAKEEFSVSVEGVLKLLSNLKPGKAAGPDKIKPLLLRELRVEIAPILQIIFKQSLQSGKLPADWCRAFVTSHRLQTTDRSPLHAYYRFPAG